jgi:hypothetical protein
MLVQRPTPNLEHQASVFMTPGDRVAQLYPQALGTHFSRLLRYEWVQWDYSLVPPPHGNIENIHHITDNTEIYLTYWLQTQTYLHSWLKWAGSPFNFCGLGYDPCSPPPLNPGLNPTMSNLSTFRASSSISVESRVVLSGLFKYSILSRSF